MRYGAILLIAATLLAQDNQGKRMRTFFETAVKRGSIDTANKMMVEGFMRWLSEDSEEARAALTAAADHVRKSSEDAAWGELVPKLLTVATWAMENGGEGDHDAIAAHAEALLCRARFNDDPTRNGGAGDWNKAVDLYLKVDSIEAENGKALARAVQILQEAAGATAGTPEMTKRAAKLIERGSKNYPSNGYFRELGHKQKLRKIEALLEEDRKAGKKAMETYLWDLEKPISDPGGYSVTFYNDAVTVAKLHKLGLKAKYLTEQKGFGSNLLVFKVPKGKRWKWSGSRLYQYGPDGRKIRHFSFYTYKWTTLYYVGRKEFGGDNIKGLARLGEHNVLEVIQKVQTRKKRRRKRLNRYCPHSQALTVGGIDEDGDYLCYHLYYFKAKKTKLLTFKLTIFEEGKYKKLDPEAKFVLDSIREP